MAKLAEQANYRMDALKSFVFAEFNKTRSHVTDTAEGVNKHTDEAIGGVKRHINNAKNEVNRNINEAKRDIKKVHQHIDEVNGNVEVTAQQVKEIESVSSAISNALNSTHVTLGRSHKTTTGVENLKQKIIQSTNIDHNKKMKLLNKLLNLLQADYFITDEDLDAIHKETIL